MSLAAAKATWPRTQFNGRSTSMPLAWIRNLIRSLTQRPSRTSRRFRKSMQSVAFKAFHPRLEALEHRVVPTFIQTALLAPPNIAAVGDFNGDGHTDIVTVLNTSPGFPSSIGVALGN